MLQPSLIAKSQIWKTRASQNWKFCGFTEGSQPLPPLPCSVSLIAFNWGHNRLASRTQCNLHLTRAAPHVALPFTFPLIRQNYAGSQIELASGWPEEEGGTSGSADGSRSESMWAGSISLGTVWEWEKQNWLEYEVKSWNIFAINKGIMGLRSSN